MNLLTKLTISLLLLLALYTSAFGQPALIDDEDIQQWNDVQVTLPVHKKIDISVFTTLRFGGNLSQVTEGRVGGFVAFKPSRSIALSPGYAYIETRNAFGAFRTERRYGLRATYKFPTKGFGLSHRSQYEYRVRSSGNSWRYRPSLTLEKELPEKLIKEAKIFVTEEPFYVSATRKFSRNRLSVGVSKDLSDLLTLELYYLRQNDGFSRPGDLNVIGTTWKIQL